MALVEIWTSLDMTSSGYILPDLTNRNKTITLSDYEQGQIIKSDSIGDEQSIQGVAIYNSSELVVHVVAHCFTGTQIFRYYHSISYLREIQIEAGAGGFTAFIDLIKAFEDHSLPKITVLDSNAYILDAPIAEIRKNREYRLPS